MIHNLLLILREDLPFYPPAMIAVAAALCVVLSFWLFGRSRGTILFAAAALFIAAGLVVGLIGLDKPGASGDWGDFEDVAEGFIGPRTFRKWEQVTTATVAVAAGLLYIVYNSAFSEKPGERARQRLEGDAEQSRALGSARLCAPATFRRWRKHATSGWTLRGEFWGAKGQRLGKRLCLSGEDIARGVAVFGPQGSGKTQSIPGCRRPPDHRRGGSSGVPGMASDWRD